MYRLVHTSFLAVLITIALSGCTGSSNKVKTAQLKGRVTVDNQPVEQGSLQFLPIADGQPTGAEIKAGGYEAEVPLGKVRVVFTANRPTGRMVEEYSSSYPEVVNLIPARYAQGLEVEVVGDNAARHFALTTQ